MTIAEQLREEGMKEGELQNARKIAKNLLRLNMDKDQITKATGLSQEEIEQLEKEM